MNEALLTVSGTIPTTLDEEIAHGQRPQADYKALARACSADLLDYAAARRITDRFGLFLDAKLGPNAMLAWTCFLQRHRYRVIFTDGEQVGLPLALFLKYFGGHGHRAAHVMIVHVLSVKKKTVLIDTFALHEFIDTFVVYSTWQQEFIKKRWKLPNERVVFTPFMVDSRFFLPGSVSPSSRPEWLNAMNPPIICSVGLERRDYPTLLEAVRGLDVRVIIAAASPWSKQSDTTRGREVPENVLVRKFTQYELRFVYDACSFLVMPLYDVDFQAGVTAILEAMAMERSVICTRTPGQTDVVREGETGLYVPPQDPGALRAAIERLLKAPDDARRMGTAGRRVIDNDMSLARYCERLAGIVQQASALPHAGPIRSTHAD